MSIIKSFSVGNGDLFYIKHGNDNFSIIDCCLSDDNREEIVNEIVLESKNKGVTRFISTHPDDDHIRGLEYLDNQLGILNFYCVKNEATKKDETDDFRRYCRLRDDSKKSFYIEKGCSRRWMNLDNEERGSAGINILWPDISNEDFKDAINTVKNGESPNNISPIIKYGLKDGATVLWMGDMEDDFLERIKDELELPNADIIFAPHHGRKSGKIPSEVLKCIDPKIVVIGEAPSEDLDYYENYKTITQNSAGDIIFECVTGKVHIYASNSDYEVDFLDYERINNFNYYIGTLNL